MIRERLIELLRQVGPNDPHSAERAEMLERLEAGEDIDPPAPLQWITQMPVLSTAHLDAASLVWLARKSVDTRTRGHGCPVVVDVPGGWMLQLPRPEGMPQGLPQALCVVIRWTQGPQVYGSQRYFWLRLDEQGDVIEGLPTFEG